MKIESSRVNLHRDDCETSAAIIFLDARSRAERYYQCSEQSATLQVLSLRDSRRTLCCLSEVEERRREKGGDAGATLTLLFLY